MGRFKSGLEDVEVGSRRPPVKQVAPVSEQGGIAGALTSLQRSVGNKATTQLVQSHVGTESRVPVQRAVLDSGDRLNRAGDALEHYALPAEEGKAKGFFRKVANKVRGLFNKGPKKSEREKKSEDRSWAANKIEEDKVRSQALAREMSGTQLGEPGKARAEKAQVFIRELRAIDIDLEVMQELLGNVDAVKVARQQIEIELSGLRAIGDMSDLDPTMNFRDALDAAAKGAAVRVHAESLNQEITRAMGGDNPFGTLFRGEGPYKGAQQYMKGMLEGQITQLLEATVGATGRDPLLSADMASERFPNLNLKSDDPPPEFRTLVHGVIDSLKPIAWPGDAGYVSGNVLAMLVPVYQHVVATQSDNADKLIRTTLVDLLFLRGQFGTLTPMLMGRLKNGSVGSEAAIMGAKMMLTAVNGAGAGKYSEGWQGDVQNLIPEASAFLDVVVGKLKAAAGGKSQAEQSGSKEPALL